MPDDYYVSQYSGEEIDERLTSAHNAVRYDAAQSLTDAQKTQARGNIGAAPAGYGWGDASQYTFATNEEFKAWFMQNAAPKCARNTFAASVHIKSVSNYRILIIASGNDSTSEIVIVGYAYNGCELRATIDGNGIWTPWEYVNPPMFLGVEYRTTERYNGKPVYAKLVDCGAGPNATRKTVSAGISNVDRAVSANGSWGAMSIPFEWFSGDSRGAQAITVALDSGNIEIASTVNYSARTIYALIKYTKTTD